jgi:hypothetical protein
MATVRNAMENADAKQRRKLAQQQALNSAAKTNNTSGLVRNMEYTNADRERDNRAAAARNAAANAAKQPSVMRPVQPGLRPMPVQPPSMRPGVPIPPSVRPQPIGGMVPNPNAKRPAVPAKPTPKPALKPVAPPRKKPTVKRINYGGMR